MVAAEDQRRVWRSRGRLADGREILYFDESPATGRAGISDSRDLPPRPALPSGSPRWQPSFFGANGLRHDSLTGELVMYAAGRQDRPHRPEAAACPLCPSRPGRPTEIPAPGYDVVVFENRFPALDARTGGRCEVVCFTDDHAASFAGLSRRRVRTVFEAWADRTTVLGALPGVAHVYCFENRGEEIGVTLHHPHGQVYAFPFVPPRTLRLLARARAHRAGGGQNLFDDLVAAEVADGRRIVTRNEHWTAFVPWAARWPFEVMIFPAERVADLAGVGEAARAAFAQVYLDVLGRLDRLFGVPMPYIAAWQQAPAAGAARAEFALHLHVMGLRRASDKLKYQAGTESGAGAWSNDVLPEDAARMLREAGDGG